MLARLQQLTTCGLLLLATLWIAGFAYRGRPGWAALGAVFIVGGYAIVLGLEFVLLHRIGRGDTVPRARAAELVRAWLREVCTAPRVFCWQQPFRSNRFPDFLPEAPRRTGLVLVHGYVCNRGFWNPWLPRLRAAGVAYVAVNLEPVFGSIDDYTTLIDRAVRRVTDATGRPPIVVGHSMGGVAVRAWMATHPAEVRVQRVVTIGTPHGGTFLGRFALSPNARQMSIESAWLRELAAGEPSTRRARFLCFYGNCDNIVFPARHAMLPGADNRHVAACPHVYMAYHPEVFSEVLRCVDAAG